MTTLIAASVLSTATISGILGLGGGMILMGVLTSILAVEAAMILHGVTQLASNGSRAFIHRQNIRWGIFPLFALAAGKEVCYPLLSMRLSTLCHPCQ